MRFIDVRDYVKAVPDAQIYMFVGERSDGKTHSSLSFGLDRFEKEELPFVYVRRLDTMLSLSNMRYLFQGNENSGDLRRHMNKFGYDGLVYYSRAFWPYIIDEKGKSNRLDSPVAITRSISTWESNKGASLPHNGLLIFDEFLSREGYLPGEVLMFENLMSSVFREKGEGKVIMLGNPVSWDCPYFVEWGLKNIRKMEQGTYDIYEQELSDGRIRKIVVVYLAHSGAKASDVFFTPNNERVRGITEGKWEIGIYPRIPIESGNWDRGESCYVQSYNDWTLMLQPVQSPDGNPMLFVYNNGRRIIDVEPPYIDKRYRDKLVYTDFVAPCSNVRFCMTNWRDNMTKFILAAFHQGRVYYKDGVAGENFRSYMMFCEKFNPIGV